MATIGLLGSIGSGKNTVADILVRKHGFVRYSFASTLKDATASIFGWPRNLLEGDTEEGRKWREEIDPWWAKKMDMPNFTPRLALQLLGTEVFRNHFHSDIWINSLLYQLETQPNTNKVISDARFFNEVRAIHQVGGMMLRIDRGSVPVWWEIAVRAYNGDTHCEQMMRTVYKDVHESEWAWAGCVPAAIIRNEDTLERLERVVDELVEIVLAEY
jgi:hypothetical protein